MEFDTVTVRVELPEPPGKSEMLAGLNPVVMVEDVVVAVIFTVEVRPALLRVIVALPLEPAAMDSVAGLAAIVKLAVTVIVMMAGRTIVPLVALTVIV